MSDSLVAAVNRARGCAGFLPVEAVAALADDGVLVLDPFSTLVSPGVTLAAGVTLWPGTIIQATGGGEVTVGSGTRLFPGTRIVAAGARVTIGADTEIGEEGGFTIKADHPDGLIEIGSRVRLLGAGSLALDNHIGDGAQVLGAIRMRNCRLQAGGSHSDPDPDRRGGVLKGSGVARGLTVPTGMVIQAFGLFNEAPLRPQSFFHPKQRTCRQVNRPWSCGGRIAGFKVSPAKPERFNYDAVVQACCDAWNALTATPERLRSLTSYPWLPCVNA